VYEELFFTRGIDRKWNIAVTVLSITVCYTLAITIPQIADVVSILGSTTNPIVRINTNSKVGFTLPITFYLKLVPDIPKSKRIFIHGLNFFVILIGILGMKQYIDSKMGE
jgi:hypothetical protein